MNRAQFDDHIDVLIRAQHGVVAPTAAALLLGRVVAGTAVGPHLYHNFVPLRLGLLAAGLARLRRLDGPRGDALNDVMRVLSAYHCRGIMSVAPSSRRRLAILVPVFDRLYEQNKVCCDRLPGC